MEEGGSGRRAPRYEGEDTSETTDRELRGWYIYGLAAEVFAVCGVGSFLPVTLEQLAKENAVLWSDKTTSCMTKPPGEGANATAIRLLARAGEKDNTQCVIHLFGADITTSSFAMYTFSLAVFIQALAFVSFSAVADHGNYRKKLLTAFGFTGAVSSMLFILVVPKIYLLGAFLVVIGVTCLGSSFVLLNSFLPLLVANHPSVQGHAGRSNYESSSIPLESLSGSRDSADHDPYATMETKAKSTSAKLQLSSKISSKGVGIGYCAAVFVQILSILLLFSLSKTKTSSTLPLRLVLFIVGIWWFAFTIPATLYLRSRPGPPLTTASHSGKLRSSFASVSFAWLSLFRTVKLAFQLKQMVIFLVAWFLLSDAVATLSGTAILFARTELHMETVAIALLSITVMCSGIAGAFVWPILSRRLRLPTNLTIVGCICLMETIPLYGLVGYIPFIKSWGVGGLQKAWEIYPLGFVHGFVMGGISSYCRSFYGQLIPPNNEAAFYALFAITDKGSSAVGPAVVGVIVDRMGSIRPAFVFLAILIALPAPLVWMVDAKKGQEDAARMAGLTGKTKHAEVEIDDIRNDVHESEGLMINHD